MTPAFKKVVVPVEFEPAKRTDFAPHRLIEMTENSWVVVAPPTEHALRLAAELVAGGQVCLVHATPDLRTADMYRSPKEAWIPQPNIDEMQAAAIERSKLAMERLATRCCEGVDVIVDARPGAAFPVIMDAAERHGAEAIVLAASGRGRVERALLGSVADRVIRHAKCPVVVVPSGTE